MYNAAFRPLKDWVNLPVLGHDVTDLAALRQHHERKLRRELSASVTNFEWIALYFAHFTQPEHFTAFYRVLMTLRQIRHFENWFRGAYMLEGIKNIALHFDRRVREPETWDVKSTDGQNDIFAHLADHLFAQYRAPHFLRRWLHEGYNPIQPEWYFHVVRGGSLFELKGTPIPVTRAMAHELANAPDNQWSMSVFRWAQLRTLGLHEDVIAWLEKSPLMDHFQHNEFWESVFRLLARDFKPDQHDEEDLATIMVYLGYMKLGMITDRVDSEWSIRYVEPPFPELEMQGRKVSSLLRAARRWYAGNRAVFGQWESAGYPSLVVHNDPEVGEGEYHLVELLNSYELSTEGQMMSHCVADYADSVREGNCSIWSLRRIQDGRSRRMVTIEVNRQGHYLAQVCGPCNEPPTELDLKLIRRWGALASIGLAEWAPEEVTPQAEPGVAVVPVDERVAPAVVQPAAAPVRVPAAMVRPAPVYANSGQDARDQMHADSRRLALFFIIAVKVAMLLFKLASM